MTNKDCSGHECNDHKAVKWEWSCCKDKHNSSEKESCCKWEWSKKESCCKWEWSEKKSCCS